ncbi:hypothetical protein ASE14_12255 [Agromyces sp. Root81]|nr:hypothetical protein ASE14_12255 [Agromyces sp. Root81]
MAGAEVVGEHSDDDRREAPPRVGSSSARAAMSKTVAIASCWRWARVRGSLRPDASDSACSPPDPACVVAV